MALRHAVLARDLRARLADVHGEGVLDSEDRVGGFIGVVTQVERAIRSSAFSPPSMISNQIIENRRGSETYVIK